MQDDTGENFQPICCSSQPFSQISRLVFKYINDRPIKRVCHAHWPCTKHCVLSESGAQHSHPALVMAPHTTSGLCMIGSVRPDKGRGMEELQARPRLPRAHPAPAALWPLETGGGRELKCSTTSLSKYINNNTAINN